MKTTAKRKEGLKADGTLKKGYRYAAGGRIVKAKTTKPTSKKTVAKKATKRTTSKKK